MGKLIAAYGGGFKPPTVGHFEVVKKALSELPDVEEFIVYVGGGERGGINQAQSILIWEIYQTYLPMKVKIVPSKAPIGDIVRLGKNNLQDTVYFVIGARDGNEGDMADVNSRTKNIEAKYPNMKIKIITTVDKGISGTNARKASQVSYEDFTKYIPSELSDSEKEEVYDIVKPPLDENKDLFGLNEYAREFVSSLSEITLPKATQQIQKLNPDIDAEEMAKDFIRLSPNLDKKDLFQYKTYNELEQELNQAIKSKTQRKKQAKSMDLEDNKYVFYKDDNFTVYKLDNPSQHPESCELAQGAKICVASNSKKYWNQYMVDGDGVLFYIRNKKHDIPHPESIIAFMFPRKGLKVGYTEMVDYNDEDFVENGNYKEQKEYLNSTGLPSNVIEKMFNFVPKPESLDTYINQYEGKKKKIKVDGDEYSIFTPDAPPGMEAVVFENSEGEVIGSVKGKSMGAYIKLNPLETKWIKVKFPNLPKSPIGITTSVNRYFDENATELDLYTIQNDKLIKTGEASLPYGNEQINILLSGGELEVPEGFKTNESKKPTSLNENASYNTDISIESKIMQLTQHMLDKGYNIEPLPKVEFVDGDSDNAREFLGRTAYYNPPNQTITLYTEGRHPKDIVRSFSHEMIHHIQNLEDRLGDIGGTNTMEDDHLNDIEAEANLKGTMTFRNWTDSLNENIDKETENQLKQYIEDYSEVDVGLLKNLIKLKSKFPNQLDPTVGGNEYAYRGTTFDKDYISKLKVKNDSNGIIEYEVPPSLKLTSKGNKGFLSFTIDEKVAQGFGQYSGYVDHKSSPDRVGGYVKVSLNNPNFILHPDYTGELSKDMEYSKESEKETLYVGNSYTPESIYVVEKDTPLDEGKKVKDPFGLNQYSRELATELEEEIVMEGKYDTITNKLSSTAFKIFKDAHDSGAKNSKFKITVGPDDEDIFSDQFEFDYEGTAIFTDDIYSVDGGTNAGFDDGGDEITPSLQLNFKIPKNPDWQEISFDLKDVVRHELEHLTQDGENEKQGKYMKDDQIIRNLIDADQLPKAEYFKLKKEVDAMLQGLYFKAKKSKKPFGDVINNYLDVFVNQNEISTEDKDVILKIWRSRRKALSLPLFEQTENNMEYTIYSDMDGVLTDFDASFLKASDGILPSEYQKNFGKNGFWKLIDKAGVGFWVGMPWMSDGKTYWDYIKEHNPTLLSSPSMSSESRLGKRLWVKNNLPGTKLILAQAKDKQNYACKDCILIDDRPSNIDQWRSKGGIGILHTSASDTIQQLKELGI